jgi:hypothetical protein
VPLKVTGATLSTVQIQTSRGPATAPAWEFTIQGTSLRATRVAFSQAQTVTVTRPSWDPNDTPAGMAIDSATTTTSSKRLTVKFTGAPRPGTEPCGADYTTEAVESAHAVVVIVLAHPHATDEVCTAIGWGRTATVDLGRPLGDRAVLEVVRGLPVPVTISGG